jgi:hypothetical protein
VKQARIERGTTTGRIPLGVATIETPEEKVIAVLKKYAQKPEKYDLAWKSQLHQEISRVINILSGDE